MQIIAHRGVSAHAPENTIAAFDMALEIGADAIETDVRSTKDGVLVLCHDSSTGRIADKDLIIAETEYSALAALDLGKWFSPEFSGQRIVTPEDFLRRYAGRIPLCIEIKAPAIEAQVLDLIKKYPSKDVTITAFEYETLRNVRQLHKDMYLGYLVWDINEEVFARIDESRIDQVCPNIARVSEEQVRAARLKGLSVRAWGVTDESLMRKVIALKMDGLTVNHVPEFQKLLAEELS